jgi:hypothetical protein
MSYTNLFATRGLISRPTALFVFLGVTLCGFSTVQSAEPTRPIARPETIQKMSSESEEEFALRKRRLTYGTPENRKYCQNELSVYAGLCKGGSELECSLIDLYKATCVAPGENAEAAFGKLPALSQDDYFDYRDGRWVTRAEYCSWLTQQPVSRRNASMLRRQYEKSCSGLPSGGSR